MITSVFSKSRPINYILITSLLILCFTVYQFNTNFNTISGLEIVKKIAILIILIGSLFITNFITKKNSLSKDNSYTFLLVCVFFILFPTVFSNASLVISNALILLALRRLISMQSMITPKEKIFDASIWIFAASLFHFWSIIFILLVYISIIFHVSRDYRNWIIPFIGFFTVVIISVLFSLIFDPTLIESYIKSIQINLNLKYIETIFQSFALGIYIVVALLAFLSMLFILSHKSLNLQASYKKIIYAFILGLIIFFISPHKDNSYLIFTFVTVAIMLTNYLETIEKYWIKETILGTIIFASLLNLVLRLL
ncbi:DUF6427 family protein [Flavobacterium terrae]|uniref:Uncharacterized protein n=1 Tax=Flavobacterium terrae TaxID=415425 RepID=A0A1M6AS60_9FLAO|nr:DUF6427 family protein [Flavobacterium terrae]SHI39168.1 hypothetical protein SAMN05444363_0367 [Flavobacterium terrae]